ncbi:class I SAM-dependent methyltransferase, partial [Mycobacterium sp. 21AC1]|nr:class I SAM-dependent methyltransferase [Mycobacterium sp. 21AC1]
MATGLSARARLTMGWLRAEYWLARKLLPDVYSNDALITFNT